MMIDPAEPSTSSAGTDPLNDFLRAQGAVEAMKDSRAEGLPSRYQRDGFISGIDILGRAEALSHRQAMEAAERRIGALHYRAKIHTIALSPLQCVVTIASTISARTWSR